MCVPIGTSARLMYGSVEANNRTMQEQSQVGIAENQGSRGP
jgi:hypothetical protein